jgi:outer membrane biosynthesis protein TonB
MMGLVLLCGPALCQTDTSQAVQLSEHDSGVYTIVEEMPKYPGGDAALLKYIAENIKYPPIEEGHDIPSTIYLSYIVDVDGQVKDVRVVRGGNEIINDDIIQIISNIKGYEPGRQRGEAVPVQFTIPIRIHFN